MHSSSSLSRTAYSFTISTSMIEHLALNRFSVARALGLYLKRCCKLVSCTICECSFRHPSDSDFPQTYPFQSDRGNECFKHGRPILPEYTVPPGSREQRLHGPMRSCNECYGLHGLQATEAGDPAARSMEREQTAIHPYA